MTSYPENSLYAFKKAAELGFSYIELDIQISKDSKAIVIHDEDLLRTVGIKEMVCNLTSEELSKITLLAENKNIQNSHLLQIATLKKAVSALNSFKSITLFVEIKEQSIEKFGLQKVMNSVLGELEHAKINIVIISFSHEVVKFVKEFKNVNNGWVLRKYNQSTVEQVVELNPDYIFCNVKKISKPAELLKGAWKWALYDVMNPAFACELLMQGVDLIETGDIVRLNSSEEFQ